MRTPGVVVALAVWYGPMAGAWACTCAPPPPPPEAVEQAAAVFTGVARRVRTIADFRRAVDLQVVESVKGSNEYVLTVVTAADPAMCGYPFEVDGYYVVYAGRDARGHLAVSLCSRTRPMDPNSRAEEFEAMGFPPMLATLTPTHVDDARAVLATRAMQFPEPRWAVHDHAHGLRMAADGLWRDRQRLTIEPAPTPLAAAALYEDAGVLMTVAVDGTVVRHERQGDVYRATSTLQPGAQVSVHEVRWTRVPGVLYLLMLDLRDGRSEPFVQWVTLTVEPTAWHGLPVDDPDEWLLGGSYRVTEASLLLSLRPGSWVDVPLPEPLAEPAQSRPYDPVPQSVYVVPDLGIFCRTLSGWTRHAFDGSLQRRFTAEGIAADAWSGPEFTGVDVLVRARRGAQWTAYRLDEAAGRLVPRETPRHDPDPVLQSRP
jgi:hypothetical protein